MNKIFENKFHDNTYLIELLNETVHHAITNTKYYQQAFAEVDTHISHISDLNRFPILSRDELIDNYLDIVTRDTIPEYVLSTGGTEFQSGTSSTVWRFRSEAERQVWLSLYHDIKSEIGTTIPLELRLITAEHGLDFPGAIPGVFSLPLESLIHFENILHVLTTFYRFPKFSDRVRIISAGLTSLKALTLKLQEKGLQSGNFDIDSVLVYGWHLTERWRNLFQDYWGVRVSNVYGLSEIPGFHSIECPYCGLFHFPPLTVSEVLGLDSDDRVREGIGRLVVTSLFPLVQAQPMIRYDTKDIIDVISVSCPAGYRVGFKYLGRDSTCIYHPNETRKSILINSVTLSEILDRFEDIAIKDHYRVSNLELSAKFGWQKYQITSKATENSAIITLEVELNWSPSAFAQRARVLRNSIMNEVIRMFPQLRKLIDANQLKFVVKCREPESTTFQRIV